jgi:hypothetical protein
MKPTLTYGLGIAIAAAILTFIEYFLGLHNDPVKFATGQIVGAVGGVAITVTGLILGMRAVRESRPDRSLSYGRAVGTGTLITLFSGIFGAIFLFVYGKFINPEFHELIYQAQVDKMAEKGMNDSQIGSAEPMMRFFSGPVWIALAQLVFAPIIGAVLSLIIAIFVKRPPATEPPPQA